MIAVLALASAVSAANFAINVNGVGPFGGVPASAQVGDSISFPNLVGHAVVDVDDATFSSCQGVSVGMAAKSGISGNSDGYSFTFAAPGTYNIICPVGEGSHCRAGMRFSLVVTDAAAVSPSAVAPSSSDAAAPVSSATTTSAAAASDAMSVVATSTASSVSVLMTGGAVVPAKPSDWTSSSAVKASTASATVAAATSSPAAASTTSKSNAGALSASAFLAAVVLLLA
ncbi:hypothetical protein BC830DRAFT_1174035 [Chytriomyces sp. MP71]|nr:hypothetical protein BC830DRAFT_1174035 [Chytriomyces sp. MP71]